MNSSSNTAKQIEELTLALEELKLKQVEEDREQHEADARQLRTEAKLKYAIDYKKKTIDGYNELEINLKEQLKAIAINKQEKEDDLYMLMEINLELDDPDEYLDDILPISVVNEINKQHPLNRLPTGSKKLKSKKTTEIATDTLALETTITKVAVAKNKKKDRTSIYCYYPDKLVLRANAPHKENPNRRCILEVVWNKKWEVWIDRHTGFNYGWLNTANIAWSKERGYKPTNAWKDFRALNMETGKTKSMLWGADDPVPDWITNPEIVCDYVDDLFVFPKE
jgi:hypothetical protein